MGGGEQAVESRLLGTFISYPLPSTLYPLPSTLYPLPSTLYPLPSTPSPLPMLYLDNHATTRTDPRVVEAMLPYFLEDYGNPGSVSHAYGQRARDAVEASREAVAEALRASSREILFTSGATESNNLALRGVYQLPRRRGNHMVTVATEHKAVLDPLRRLERQGMALTVLAPQQIHDAAPGWLDPQQVAEALRDDTTLVSVMLANNEIGVLQPLAEIGRLCKERGVLLHCDATQAVGRLPVDVNRLQVDLLSFSGHKIYGPKGVGVLYVRRKDPRVRLAPQLDGGGQEFGMRSGTLNVTGIVGLQTALQLCLAELPAEAARLAELRDRLHQGLLAEIDGMGLNGPPLDRRDLRLPANLNCWFDRVDGEALMMSMGELAVSSGSACTSANPEPSHVLRAIGQSEERTRASLRFGLGRFNTTEDVTRATQLVAESVHRLRRMLG